VRRVQNRGGRGRGVITEEQSADAWVAREYVSGRYQHEIATDIGVTSGAVCHRIERFCRSLGYPVRHRIYGPGRVVVARKALSEYRGEFIPPTERDLKYRQAYADARHEYAWLLRAEGLTLQQIGDRFGVSRERAREMIAKFARRVKRATRKTHWRLT
jgi:hypothetical protein